MARVPAGTAGPTALASVSHCGIAQYIDAVIGGDCVERGKPHPEMIDRARALFTVAPQRTLMVGDTSDPRCGPTPPAQP